MKSKPWFLIMGLELVIGTAWAAQGVAQTDTGRGGSGGFQKAEPSMFVILVGAGDGQVQSVSAGVVCAPTAPC